jgi:hypothetical protein
VGRRICVGPGPYPVPGFENVDLNLPPVKGRSNETPIVQGDALDLDYTGAEIVFAGHFIEHLDPTDADRFLRRVRAQAPEATLILVVPVLDRCNDQSVDFALLQQIVSHHALKPDSPRGISHRSWWRTRDLMASLQHAGYAKVTENPACPYLTAAVPWQICLYAKS